MRSVVFAVGFVAGLVLGRTLGFRHGQGTMLTAAEDELRKHGLLNDKTEEDRAEMPGEEVEGQAATTGKQPDEETPSAR